MLTSKAKFSANAATTFGLATTVAALWMAAVPFAGAVADVQISAARAAAIQECNRLAARYPTNDWGNTHLSVSVLHGPAWPTRMIGKSAASVLVYRRFSV